LAIVALCWARQPMNLRKRAGFIPKGMLGGMARRSPKSAAALARELVEAGKPLHDVGIWVETEGGWLIHDFDQYGIDGGAADVQPTIDQPEEPPADPESALAAMRSEAARLAGKASAEARRARGGTAQPRTAPNGSRTESSVSLERLPNGTTNGSERNPERNPERLPNGSRTAPNGSAERSARDRSSLTDRSQDLPDQDLRITKENPSPLKTCQVSGARELPNGTRTISNGSSNVALNDTERPSNESPIEARRIRPGATCPPNLAAALALPLPERCAAVLDNSFGADFAEPARWPEVVEVARAFETTFNRQETRFGSVSQDTGLKALLGRFREGYAPPELVKAINLAKTDEWFSSKPRGLSSFTPEVVRRLLDKAKSIKGPAVAKPWVDPDKPDLAKVGFPEDFEALSGDLLR